MLYRIVPAGDIDLVIGDDGLTRVNMLAGPPRVRQTIATKLKFFLGEWINNLREGVPYYRLVLLHNPDLDLVRLLYRRVILSVQEVSALTKLTLDYDPVARTVAVEFDVTLVDGGVLAVRQPDQAFVVDFKLATAT